MTDEDVPDRNLALELVRVTEAAAMALKRTDIADRAPTDRTAEEQAASAKSEANAMFAKLKDLKRDDEDDAPASG